ncbi:MAG TPA: hypothetical protein VLG50_08360 [Candidatus Saccharimonadales bacterium]|nr:hypothetical protein [Candidatus Saccharimonadales bacterium]
MNFKNEVSDLILNQTGIKPRILGNDYNIKFSWMSKEIQIEDDLYDTNNLTVYYGDYQYQPPQIHHYHIHKNDLLDLIHQIVLKSRPSKLY